MCELLHTKNHHYFDGNNKGPLYQCAQTPTAIHPLPIPGVGVCTGRLRPPRAGWPRPAARAAGDAQGDAREPAAWEPSGAASERAPRPRWRERIPARLQDGPQGHRVEAARLALPLRSVEGLAEVQESGSASSKARGRRGLGKEEA